MNTPLGWARANIFYEKSQGTPRPGSLAEVVCVLVWKRRTSTNVAQARAIAQASLGGEQAVDAFSEYRDLVNNVDIKHRNDQMRERLEELKKIKEIRFHPIDTDRTSTRTVRTVPRPEVLDMPQLSPISRTRPQGGT